MHRSGEQHNTPAGPRQKAELCPGLDRTLVAYVAAAAASGVGLMSFSQSAEAKIVYTPANMQVASRNVPLDLNHDGVTDFLFNVFSIGHSFGVWCAPTVTGNGMKVQGSAVVAMFFGQPVGPVANFNTNYYGLELAGGFRYGSSSGSGGPFANVTNRYLGVKFLINGQTHFGWARINGKLIGTGAIGMIVTGYAYETIPNKPVQVGHLHPSKVSAVNPTDRLAPSQPPAGLGLLARGADGLAIWRRENEGEN